MSTIEVLAEIKRIKYRYFLCNDLKKYKFTDLEQALSEKGSFILEIGKNNEIAVSWWVSPKRTRSYPYARVYDTMSFGGKKVTIIPVIKDEGKDGDRDFLQWDTISLMSLLGVYVIIAYYIDAERNKNYKNKITDQKFDITYIRDKIQELLSYQSDALHWNLDQIEEIHEIGERAVEAYENISKKLGVTMHSLESACARIQQLKKGKNQFMVSSRKLAHKAQLRESRTVQPKECLSGVKGIITIKNYLGGYYYFTCDEIELHGEEVHLIEGKHTKTGDLPAESDIKDGLIKMVLYTNLENVTVQQQKFTPIPVLKLTTNDQFDLNSLSTRKKNFLEALKQEACHNGFKVKINDTFI